MELVLEFLGYLELERGCRATPFSPTDGPDSVRVFLGERDLDAQHARPGRLRFPHRSCGPRDSVAPRRSSARRPAFAPSTSICGVRGCCDSDPTAALSTPRRSGRLPGVLGRSEVQRLLEQPKGTDPIALRDRALLELMYACGLRASEAVDLELSQVDLDEGMLRVRGKGSKERIVPVGSAAKRAVGAYLGRAAHSCRRTRRDSSVRQLPRRPADAPGPLQDHPGARRQRVSPDGRSRTPFATASPRIFSPVAATCVVTTSA